MKNLLSIGDLGKIKKVTAKALRYYEKLGILIPAYINPDTGYRYYSTEQLLLVDLIQICMELGIPLKNFKKYMTEDEAIDIQKLLDDGNRLVDERIMQLNTTKSFLNNVSVHVTRSSRIKGKKEPFVTHFSTRYLLTLDYTGDISDYVEINVLYTKLFNQAKEIGLADKFNQGILFVEKETKVFLEIPKPRKKVKNLFVVPDGEFLSRTLPFEDLSNIDGNERFLIIQELFDLEINTRKRFVELQLPLS